jgi:glyoxylase-like metal-dependent hydrolase (beta-lactamase superfamily II)
MTIQILGTRGEIELSAPNHLKHSGMLIDDKILIDVGEKKYLKLNPDVIFITHLHPDHAFFLKRNKQARISVPVFAPEKITKSSDLKINFYTGHD